MILRDGQRRGWASRTFGRKPSGLAIALVATVATLAAPTSKITGGLGSTAMAADPHGKRAEAKAEFEKAQLHYRLGRFEEALKAYTRAYELFNAPALLFNIGQCHKNLGNYERAIFFFQGYLREETNPEKRRLAEELISSARGQLERQRIEPAKVEPGPTPPGATPGQTTAPAKPDTGTTTPATGQTPAPVPAIVNVDVPPAAPVLVGAGSPETPEPEHQPAYRKWWFWTAIGATAAAVATGAAIYYATGPTTTLPPTGSVGTLDRR